MSFIMPRDRQQRQYVIGIDPDKNQSGVAVWCNLERRFIFHKALYFAKLQETCFSYDRDNCRVFVEAGWENKGMNTYQAKTQPKGFNLWSRVRREAYIFERGCDVGVNFGAGHAIIQVLRANNYVVNTYCPTIAKWDAETLRQYTGITADTNQDTRDAIRAAFMNK